MAKQLRLERWSKMSQLDQEEHLFLEGENTYVLGYNPDLINKENIQELLENEGYSVPGDFWG